MVLVTRLYASVFGIQVMDSKGMVQAYWERTAEDKDVFILTESEIQQLKENLPTALEETVFTNVDPLKEQLISIGYKAKVKLNDRVLRSARDALVENHSSGEALAQLLNRQRQLSVARSRQRISESSERVDKMVVQAIHSIDDMDKTINLFISRLREWYSNYFPELNAIITNHNTYARIVQDLGERSRFTNEAVNRYGFTEEKTAVIVELAETSMGPSLSASDIETARALASRIIELNTSRQETEDWICQRVLQIAPNVAEITGHLIAARLIALAGGISELAKFPSSTVQLLGAERALFRALKSGNKPPKHGIIYQMPELHASPWWTRGKIARAIAGKVSIAARVDAFDGEFMGDKLRTDVENRVQRILRTHPAPPPGKTEPVYPAWDEKRPSRGRPRGGPRSGGGGSRRPHGKSGGKPRGKQRDRRDDRSRRPRSGGGGGGGPRGGQRRPSSSKKRGQDKKGSGKVWK